MMQLAFKQRLQAKLWIYAWFPGLIQILPFLLLWTPSVLQTRSAR